MKTIKSCLCCVVCAVLVTSALVAIHQFVLPHTTLNVQELNVVDSEGKSRIKLWVQNDMACVQLVGPDDRVVVSLTELPSARIGAGSQGFIRVQSDDHWFSQISGEKVSTGEYYDWSPE